MYNELDTPRFSVVHLCFALVAVTLLAIPATLWVTVYRPPVKRICIAEVHFPDGVHQFIGVPDPSGICVVDKRALKKRTEG